MWLACVAFITHAAQADLPPKIQAIIDGHRIPSDGVSIVVQAVDEDAPRIALNADTPRNPASTVKLVTTWTALDMLGPTHTWRTRVYALGPIEDGVLKGDLLIKGMAIRISCSKISGSSSVTSGGRGSATSRGICCWTTACLRSTATAPARSTAKPTACTTFCRAR